MRHPLRAAAALLLGTALSSAALADPAPEAVKPAAGASSLASTPVARPASATAPARAAQAQTIRHRAAFRHHLARIENRPPVRVASIDVLPPPRPARLIDMTAQRDGVVVHPDTVQIARSSGLGPSMGQSSSCDSLLCPSYIILGAGF